MDDVSDYTVDCTDVNKHNGDGCDDQCKVETGWVCDVNGCSEVCGNEVVTIDEQCDDGNIDDHDGCSSSCEYE